MKKIIFDIDNTLLMHKDKYLNYYVKALQDMNYEANLNSAKKLYDAIGRYDDKVFCYDKDELICFVNEYLGTDYDVELIDVINNYIGDYWYEIDDEVIDVIKYLYDKYELYALTNWFGDVATRRLDKAGILKYFKEVVGGDKVAAKPHPESFLYFISDCEKEECLMIGDSVKIDYEGAIAVGMKAILCDYKDQYDDKYDKIKNIKELYDIL